MVVFGGGRMENIEREEKPLVVFVKSPKTQSTKSGVEFADTLVAASALVTAPSYCYSFKNMYCYLKIATSVHGKVHASLRRKFKV